jgi:hypothetical protein
MAECDCFAPQSQLFVDNVSFWLAKTYPPFRDGKLKASLLLTGRQNPSLELCHCMHSGIYGFLRLSISDLCISLEYHGYILLPLFHSLGFQLSLSFISITRSIHCGINQFYILFLRPSCEIGDFFFLDSIHSFIL